METPITNLSKLVVNMKIFESIFVTQIEGEPSSYSLSIEEAGDLFAKVEKLKFENMPWFLVEKALHQAQKNGQLIWLGTKSNFCSTVRLGW